MMITTMTQALQAPVDQAKAGPDLPHSTARTSTGTSHPTTDNRTNYHLGRELFLCALLAAAYLEPASNAILVINLLYQTPSSRRSTSLCMTTGAQALSLDKDATIYLEKAAVHFVFIHLQLIKNEKNFHQQILGSSFEWTKVLQCDQFLHQLELTEGTH